MNIPTDKEFSEPNKPQAFYEGYWDGLGDGYNLGLNEVKHSSTATLASLTVCGLLLGIGLGIAIGYLTF